MQLWRYEPAPLGGAVLGAYRGLIGAFGTDTFASSVGVAINALAPIDRFHLSEREGPTQRPVPIASRIEGALAEKIGGYYDRYYRRDPVARALEAAKDGGETVIIRVDASDILDTEYRCQFFDAGRTIERISFVQRAGDKFLSLNVARQATAGYFNMGEIGALADFSQLLLPLAVRQLQLSRPSPSVQDLESRFGTRFPGLTMRERQVCARTILGMTSEATAIDLGIGVGSVQTYRKRAFRRLSISSAFELAPLVMH